MPLEKIQPPIKMTRIFIERLFRAVGIVVHYDPTLGTPREYDPRDREMDLNDFLQKYELIKSESR